MHLNETLQSIFSSDTDDADTPGSLFNSIAGFQSHLLRTGQKIACRRASDVIPIIPYMFETKCLAPWKQVG